MVIIAALAFLGMGVLGLLAPERISGLVGVPRLPLAARNEVRAVYGGFGVAMGILLGVTLFKQEIREGVIAAVSIALLGMAAGRVLSWLLDWRLPRFPALFLLIELVLGFGLLISL